MQILLLANLLISAAHAEAPPPVEEVLVVGVKSAPPFVIAEPDGTWRGVSIDLWEGVARDLDLQYRYEEHDLGGLIGGVSEGTLDVAVAALTVTAEREAAVDFTHPFYSAGLGIAVAPDATSAAWTLLERLVSVSFLQAISALVAILLLVGAAVWALERRRNPDEFGGGVIQGLFNGFWWSAVTMTTVGYGDKSPRTPGGRLVALVWMFASILMISSFTAAIASALTLSHLDSPIAGPQDLGEVEVGTVRSSTSEAWLRLRRLPHRGYATPREALEALREGEIGAVVYDRPVLRWLVGQEFDDLRVLREPFDTQDYGFALVQGSGLREPMNRSILERVSGPAWTDTLALYLGD